MIIGGHRRTGTVSGQTRLVLCSIMGVESQAVLLVCASQSRRHLKRRDKPRNHGRVHGVVWLLPGLLNIEISLGCTS